jgi:hypothetical protein
MTTNPPQFAQLSTQQEKAKDRAKLSKREGHLMDMLKSSPEQLLSNRWRNLHNY